MEKVRQLLARYGPVGWMMAILASAYLALLIVNIVLGDGVELVFRELTLPMAPERFLKQPWSLLSFWAFNHPEAIWAALVDIALLYSFGMLLQLEVGRKRFIWTLALFGLAVAAISFPGVYFLPLVEGKAAATLNGFQAVNAAIIAAVILIAPRQQFRLFMWEVKVIWVGLVLLAFMVLGNKAFFTAGGVAVLSGILTGVGYGLWMERFGTRRKWDVRIRQQASAVLAKDRVRVREAPANPQHKGKFTIVHSTAKLAPEEELNRLLDRINEVGYNGLTVLEKKRLEELSGG